MNRSSQIVLTALGPDRPGLVDRISQYILQRGGNIEDSRMASLAGEFAIIMLVAGSAESIQRIQDQAKTLEKESGLSTLFKEGRTDKKSIDTVPYKITAVCLDHPGVVQHISSVFAQKKINIEAMETHTYQAPVSGSELFRLEAVVSIPASVHAAAVRKELEKIAEEENLDLKIEAM